MTETTKAIADAMVMAYSEAERLQKEGKAEESQLFRQRAEQLRQILNVNL